ncbi:MAG TPA: outer membrane beta-barrel protein [Bacteroidia bacterium]|jgi:hypothetical protein|nr:outer membrane beta-barrel protein [Bacteroidia bacterium]
MKKFYFLTAVILVSLSAHAQFRAGFSMCGLITDIQGADFIDLDNDFNKVGLAGGLIMNVSNPDDNNSFQFEINYIQKGSMQRPDSANNHYYKLSMDYIEVPLVFRRHLKFVLNKKARTRFEAEFGFSVGRVVHFKQIYNNYSQAFDDSQFNRTDVSLLVGFNYILSDHWYVGYRYSNSVIPALKRNNIPYGFFRVAFNNGNNMVHQVGIHYLFGNPVKATPTDGGTTTDGGGGPRFKAFSRGN